jgi:hypothetical protein
VERRRHQTAPRSVLILLGLLVPIACTSKPTVPGYRVHILSSGEQVKVLGVSRTSFPQTGAALILRYETDLDLTNTEALRAEAGRIWVDFRTEAERADVHGAVLSATSAPSTGIVRHSRGYNFVYIRHSDGTWREANSEFDR